MPVCNDYVVNGQGVGGIADALGELRIPGVESGFLGELGLRQVYIDKNGDRAVTVNLGNSELDKGERKPIREHITVNELYNRYGIQPDVITTNATTLRKEEWIYLDKMVVRAARWQMDAWQDLVDSSSFGGFDGMGQTILEREMMSDPGEALWDMDALSEGLNDQPVFAGVGLPLPILHAGFWFGARKLSISRKNASTQLDTVMGEASGRRIGEQLEKVTIGVLNGLTYGGLNTAMTYVNAPTVYGYLNFPQRLLKTNLTAPTAGGWTPNTTVTDFLNCIQQLFLNKMRGPFMVYTSNDWTPYLDGPYYVSITSGAVAPTETLRTYLKKIRGIQDIKRLDFLFASQLSAATGPGTNVDITLKPFTLIFVQMGDPNVARAVNGLGITTIQWPSQGGMKLNFKIITIQVPDLQADYYGNCGILVATTS